MEEKIEINYEEKIADELELIRKTLGKIYECLEK
jgi:hypothetical protein